MAVRAIVTSGNGRSGFPLDGRLLAQGTLACCAALHRSSCSRASTGKYVPIRTQRCRGWTCVAASTSQCPFR